MWVEGLMLSSLTIDPNKTQTSAFQMDLRYLEASSQNSQAISLSVIAHE